MTDDERADHSAAIETDAARIQEISARLRARYAPIPLSEDERVALDRLRILVEQGVIGPAVREE